MSKHSNTKSFAELGRLRDALRDQAEQHRLEAERKRLEAERLAREARLFRDSVGEVAPLKASGRRDPRQPDTPPRAVQFERDERAALAQSMSDELDIERLLETDAALSYHRPGIGADVVRRLRRGQWVIQQQIDLHGLRVEEAREALILFLADCVKRGLRCVRIVHGKGLGSKNREPILKGKVLRWLVQRDEVLAFCQAGPADGGSGAVVALLRAA